MKLSHLIVLFACSALCLGDRGLSQVSTPENAQREAKQIPSAAEDFPQISPRVVEAVDGARMVTLRGNTHPMAQSRFDKGPVDPQLMLKRLMLVLKRSPEQEKALAAFNERQYDPKSPDFHRWLRAAEFGKLYGPSDSDIAAITNWLQNQGFQIDVVSKGRVWIQFTGTVAQTESAFHIRMRKYLVDGKMHIANDRDPQIPQALAPVVTGIASLHDFFPRHFSHPGNYVKRDLKTGKFTELDSEGNFPSQPQPQLGYIDSSTGYQREMLTPFDVATIYNILPLWSQSTPIDGAGVPVAIVALSDVKAADVATYRSSFGLPAATFTTVHSGSDPGFTDSQGENTEDVEMVSATAPGANIILVADVSNATTDGLLTAVTYITDNSVAPILTMSYGACELALGTAGNSVYNQTFQQAATAGITSLVAAGDSGSAVCTSQNGTPPYADSDGLAVSGMASTPYVTAVGGTDLAWPFSDNAYTTYWNAKNDPTTGASALGYMPETAWNTTCTNPNLLLVYTNYTNSEAICEAAISADSGLVIMGAGSGGKSACTTNNTNNSTTTLDPTSCSGGYAKPSWQTGVAGIPTDSKRYIPDVSMFASYGFQQSTGIPGTALLICQASNSPSKSCDYTNPDYIIYQENGGTSAASPMTAGIMALVLQKTGTAQGLANPVFYQLAAKETYSSCNSNSVKAGNSCIFYDVTSGTNAQVCLPGGPNCNVANSGDDVGILTGYNATAGYDLTTGLGTMNVYNLVKAWPAAPKATATLTPGSLPFPSTKVNTTSAGLVATLKNTGSVALTISAKEINGTNYTNFAGTTTCGDSLAGGASCTITVTFTPTAAGPYSATLEVDDNSATSPHKIPITGTGTSGSSGGSVTLTPSSITFPATPTGTISEATAVTVKNTGASAVAVSSIALAGANPTSFVQVSTCGTSLAGGASCTVFVAFKPASAAALKGTLSIADNAAGSPQIATLSGKGVAKPVVGLSKTSLTFASTAKGVTTAAQSVTVTNKGGATLDIANISLTGLSSTSFIEVNTCGATLAPAASCGIEVAFKPTAAGSLKASVAIADNGSTPTQTITLTGTGH